MVFLNGTARCDGEDQWEEAPVLIIKLPALGVTCCLSFFWCVISLNRDTSRE